MISEINDVILERSFELLDKDDVSSVIKLRISKPTLMSDPEHSLKWRCHYQILGIGSEKIKSAPGVDAIDAILISLRIAEALLQSYSRVYKKKITWLGEEDLGLYTSSQVEIEETNKKLFDTDDSSFKKTFDEFFITATQKPKTGI
jgi:hypothetical protein